MNITDYLSTKQGEALINRSINEDVGDKDITTDSIIGPDVLGNAIIKAREAGVIAGIEVAQRIFQTLDPEINFHALVNDGNRVQDGDIIAKISGNYRSLLTGERTSLNFLQHLSGVATKTARFVEILKPYRTELLDTRKTLPGLRLLEKYAVQKGGGKNHRIGLYDMALIKENHIQAAGGLTQAVSRVKECVNQGIKIEVETTSIEEVEEALRVGVDIIMLDNMTVTQMSQAVRLINNKAKIEASGDIDEERLIETAQTGVDYISVGALTHSVKAFNLSMLCTSSN